MATGNNTVRISAVSGRSERLLECRIRFGAMFLLDVPGGSLLERSWFDFLGMSGRHIMEGKDW